MDREAVFGLEMTETTDRRNSMDFALLNNERRDKTQATLKQRGSKFRDWLRQARLQVLLFDFLRFKSSKFGKERRKVAIYHSRRMAALHTFFHLIPLGGAITLLVLRWTQYWIGYEAPDSTTLQFVAKFHELFMQFSIVEVTLCAIRTEALRGFVPLGALSGALQATQLSYLWSLDFISVITSSAIRGWRKIMFVIMIPALLTLTALVGPSSAVLMIPRPGSSERIRAVTLYLNHSSESLYPSYLDKSHGLHWDFPSFNATIRTSQSVSSNWYAKGPNGLGIFSYLTQGLEDDFRILRYSGSMNANATIPTRWSADSFWGVQSRYSQDMESELYNQSVGVEVAHPVVGVNCNEYEPSTNPGTVVFYYKDDKTSMAPLSNLSTLARQASGPSEYSETDRMQYFTPVYMESPEPGSHSMIAVLFTFYPGNHNATLSSLYEYVEKGNPESFQGSLSIETCTMSAYWNFGEVLSINSDVSYIVQTGLLSMSNPHKPRPIRLNLTGIEELNGAKFHRYTFDTGLDTGACLATIFATAIAGIGTSLVSLNSTDGLNWYQAPDLDSSNSTTLKYTFKRWGYGYNTQSTSIQLSVAVITAYCVIMVAYIAYIIITGSTSTAWNSAIELVALALQSRKPDYLGHTAVGIDNLNTYKEGVGIRVNNDNELELVFSHDRDFATGTLRRVERNKEY